MVCIEPGCNCMYPPCRGKSRTLPCLLTCLTLQLQSSSEPDSSWVAPNGDKGRHFSTALSRYPKIREGHDEKVTNAGRIPLTPEELDAADTALTKRPTLTEQLGWSKEDYAAVDAAIDEQRWEQPKDSDPDEQQEVVLESPTPYRKL
jgi:hypothetical protein